MHHISVSTAHPAKFSGAVKLALKDDISFNFEVQVFPHEFFALSLAKSRVTVVENSWEEVREIIKKKVDDDLKVEGSGCFETISHR